MHTKVSLNDAFLVRYISEGPTRNQCHVTAIDITGRRTLNLDPEIFCCKIWSKIVSYLNKHEIWLKYAILSQWWLHTKLNKTSKRVFAVLSCSWRYHVCDFFGLIVDRKLVLNPIPMSKVSLNDAFLVRYISEGPTRNQCHVTAIDITGRRTLNLDPEIFCCKIWSKIVSYLNKHEIWLKYAILSQWWLHTKLNKTSKRVFAVLSCSWRYHVCDFFGLIVDRKLVLNPIIWLHQFWLFPVSIIFPETTVA